MRGTGMLAGTEPYRRWLPYGIAPDRAGPRMFCLPHVGGGAGRFRGWRDAVPGLEVCPVQLPGREDRLGEEPVRRMDELVDRLAAALLPFLDVPFVLLGHSMGGIVAYELAGELWRRHRLVPSVLVVASSSAPHLIDRRHTALDGLSDDEFVRVLHGTYGGIPAELLDQPELLALYLPVLRADMELMDTYRPLDRTPVRAPVVALGGTDDPGVPTAAIEAWAEYGTHGCTVRMLPGGHFAPFAGDDLLVALAPHLPKEDRT